jgi:hypothetical protein
LSLLAVGVAEQTGRLAVVALEASEPLLVLQFLLVPQLR